MQPVEILSALSGKIFSAYIRGLGDDGKGQRMEKSTGAIYRSDNRGGEIREE